MHRPEDRSFYFLEIATQEFFDERLPQFRAHRRFIMLHFGPSLGDQHLFSI